MLRRVWRSLRRGRWLPAALLALSGAAAPAAEALKPEDVEFFEKHIRPVFAAQCVECHSDSIQAKGGLRLDVALGLQIGGQRGETLVPGKPEESLLIRALRQEGPVKMPPGEKLSNEQIGHFEEWIRRGAPDPRTTAADEPFAPREIDWKMEGALWSLQPPKSHPLPAVKNAGWPKSDIDHFILAGIEKAGLTPAKDTDKATWLRRVYLDLVGLPPTPGEVLDFELDNSPEAREKVVDRLLGSPQYGERWGRHWLDVARYGESTGKERNFVYLQAWRYRDYVIDSFNADKPFDQFVREQVAGDLLPHRNETEKDLHQIATGFLALNPKGINDRNRESFLLEIVDEQIESLTRGVMGVSVVCARCHDHKYDPISQQDYYAIGGILRSSEPRFGILNRTRAASVPEYLLPLTSKEVTRGAEAPQDLIAELKTANAALLTKTTELRRLRDALPAPTAPTAQAVAAAGVQTTIGSDGAATTTSNARKKDPEAQTDEERLVQKLDDEVKAETKAVEELRTRIAANVATTMAIGLTERPDPEDIPVRIKGEVDKPGQVVPRGFLTVLHKESTPKVNAAQSGRLELANWLASGDNPLTARVYVNRVWSKLLGAGIVRSVDNFGSQGEAPTHPELLDHLAVEFTNRGWSTKQLIRSIVLSRVYAVDSRADFQNVEVDVENKLLSRWSRKRLDAEVLRDSVLAIGGNLDLKRPYGTPLVELGTRELGPDANYSVVNRPYRHRSVYLPLLRGRAPEMMAVFDVADPSLTVGKRDVTSGPDQALYILNSPVALEEGKLVARRLLESGVADDAARIDLAFRLAFGTLPTAVQRERALESIADFQKLNTSQVSTEGVQVDPERVRLAAWANFTQTLLALPEFRYVF